MQLALRRHHGNLAEAHFAVGRALLLCGGTAIAGFGSLSLSSNAGMASLGQICAVGVGLNMLISVYLLPAWWAQAGRRKETSANEKTSRQPALDTKLSSPSSLYRAKFWRLGLQAAQKISPKSLSNLATALATLAKSSSTTAA